jgi:hypothetical protein
MINLEREKMKSNKLLFAGLFSLVGCTEINANHCAASINKCPESMICSDLTGRCEAPSAALAVTAVSPSLLPSGTDTQSKIVTVSGSGFKTAGIKSVRIAGQDLVATVVTDSELTFDTTPLLSIKSCGPMDLAVVDANNNVNKAPAEIFGRKYRKWTYNSDYASAGLNKSNINNFSVRKFDENPFEYAYADAGGVSVVAMGRLEPIFPADSANAYKKIFRSSLSNTPPSSSFPVYISNKADGVIGSKDPNGVTLTSAPSCVSNYGLVDYGAYDLNLNPKLVMICQKTTQTPSENYLSFRALSSNGNGLTESGSSNSGPVPFIAHSISFPPNAPGLGALIVQTRTTSLFSLKTLARFDAGAPKIVYTAGHPITGAAPSVFSVIMSSSPQRLIRHYVASNVNDTVSIQIIDGAATATDEGMDGPNAVLQNIVPASFAGKNLDPTVIDLVDINCDQYPDIILKLDNMVVAYLAISDKQWDWASGPKILYRNDGQRSNVKKHELWIPSYGDTSNQPGTTAVLGVLNVDGSLRFYQQE